MADWTRTQLNLRYHRKALLIVVVLLGASLAVVAWANPPGCEGWETGLVQSWEPDWEPDGPWESVAWVQGCLEAGANPNARDTDGDTPLHNLAADIADVNGAPQMALLLLDAGANPNARNHRGETPLHYVYMGTHSSGLEFVVLLLEAGANPNARDQAGHLAFHHYGHGSYEMVQVEIERALMRAGANPNLLNGDGEHYPCSTAECLKRKDYRRARMTAQPDPDYCVGRACQAGEGDCDPGQCAPGLTCVNDVGAQYGLPAHYDVCEAS